MTLGVRHTTARTRVYNCYIPSLEGDASPALATQIARLPHRRSVEGSMMDRGDRRFTVGAA